MVTACAEKRVSLIGCLAILSLLASAHVYGDCDDAPYCETKPTGAQTSVQECRDHKKVLRRRIELKDKTREGLWQCWDGKGDLLESRHYQAGLREGEIRSRVGTLHQYNVAHYKKDRLDGVSKVYETSDDKITGWMEKSYKEGEEHGLIRWFRADGTMERQVCYQNGEQVSRLSACGVDPALTHEDEVIWVEHPWPNGKLRSKRQERNGKAEGLGETYFDTGKLKTRTHWKDAQQEGLYEEYFENGVLKLKGSYKDGRPEGLWQEFTEAGQKVKEDVYDGRRLQERQIWYMNGQLSFAMRVEKRGRRGASYTEYSDDGEVAVRGFCVTEGFPEEADCTRWWGELYFRGPGKGQETTEQYGEEGLTQAVTIDHAKNIKIIDTYQKDYLANRKTFDLTTQILKEEKEFYEDGSLKSSTPKRGP